MASDGMTPLLVGLLAGLLSREEVRLALRDFTITPSENRQTLTLHFPDSWNTYRIDVRFVGNFDKQENAVAAVERGDGRD